MGWGRIDDGFDDHAKVIALLEHDDGAAAIGLWTLCFTWAHRNTRKRGKTPGLVPASLPRRYIGPKGRELAALLVKVGLWEDRGDDSWLFHDFDRYLPTEQTRDARSEAGKRGAKARWGNRAGRDSNLPSDDGKPMAADSTDSALDADEPARGTDERQRPSVNGNEPSGDSNLPSGLLFEDGKPMASDGSRTPARRAISNEIAPTPEPMVPPTAGARKPRRLDPAEVAERTRHVGEVVAAYVDGATGAGLKSPPAPLRSRVGKQARELLAEDWEIDFLIGSARRMGAGEFNDLAVQVRKDDAAANGRSLSSAAGRREQEHQAQVSRALQRAAAREARS
ncbi:MAG: hypothetical protein ACLQK8_24765 [Streptosporangiaceae bacterium]